MQTLLRSTFCADAKEDANFLLSNALELRQSGLEFSTPEQAAIWSLIDAFVSDHNHVPDIASLMLHFTQTEKNPDVVNQLQILKSLPSITRGDFKKRLALRVEERKTREAEELFKLGNQINRTGIEIKEERGQRRILKGFRDALNFVSSKSLEICRPSSGIRKEGEVTSDTKQFSEDYDRRRDDPNYAQGQLCGIQQVDELGGLRRNNLWTHAAFTGELKSTFGFNWVYNQAIYFGFSSCFFSLEMPYEQCQRIIYTMHSLHDKFNETRLSLGIQKDPHTPVPLSYRYMRDGKLAENEEIFLKKHVLPDLEEGRANNTYGQMHFRGYDPDSDYFRVSDIRAKSETLFRENPFEMILVDHVLLVDSKRAWRSTTESANEVVRDLKKLSETFNGGAGIGVVALFQISREGKKRADKSKGRYSLYDLSYSNEIERSSDIVTASYLNEELRKRCRALWQCLKSRDGGIFDPCFVRIEWSSRRLFTCKEKPDSSFDATTEEVEGTPFEELLELL